MPSALSQNRMANGVFRVRGLRYVTGACLCALISNVVLISGDWLGWTLAANVILSWLAGGSTGYLWHANITYSTATSWAAYLRFLGGALLGIPLAWLALWVCQQLLGWPMWLAAPAATLVLFGYHWANAFIAIKWRHGMARFCE